MKFPHTVRFRTKTAVIYGKTAAYPFYRAAWEVAGKRVLRSFRTFAAAKTTATEELKKLAGGDQGAALTGEEAADMLAIRQAIAAFYRDTGRKVGALELATTGLAALRLLPANVPLMEAVREYSRTLATIKSKPISEAVSEYIESRKQEPKPGERARHNPIYASNIKTWLEAVAEAFPGHKVSDLTADFIRIHLAKFNGKSAKHRNDRRATIGMWLRWCGRREFIAEHQLKKLLADDAMGKETLEDAEIEFYTIAELKKILTATEGAFRAVSALQALGGARLQEALRLQWEDLFRNPGHIEISSKRSKTRKRRLLEIGPALKQWLAEFKGRTGPLWEGSLHAYTNAIDRMHRKKGIPSKRNALRHGFVSYSYIIRGEIETSIVAGTSPAILHANYKGLARKSEARAWFNVKPIKPAAGAKILQLPEAAAV